MADFEVKYTVKPDEASLKAGAQKVADNFKDVEIKVDVDKSHINKTAKYVENEFEQAGQKAGKGFGESFKKGFGGIGSIVAGLGIANLAGSILGFVKESGKAAIELDKQVKNIGTLGVKNFEEFSARAIELSKTVPDSAANIAGAVYDAISAGITGTNDDIMKFVEVASKAGVAGMTDTGTAVNALTSVLNAYKRPVSEAANVSNELFAGVKLGKITFEEFSAGLGEAVPTAAALGVGFDEVSSSIAAITSQGVRAPQAFTKFNQLMIELQKPGTDLAKVMKGVTVTVDGVSQSLTGSNIGQVIKQQGLTETLRQIGVSADSMGLSLTQAFSSSEAASASVLLAGKNAEFAADMLKKTREEIKAGAAEQAFNIANQSIDVQLKLLQNNLQAALQPIFANILPIIGNIAKEIANIFQNPAIQKAFQSISIILGDLLSTVLPPLMDVLAPLLSGLLQFIQPIAEQLGKLIAAVLPSLNKILEPLIAMLPQIGNAFGEILAVIIPLVDALWKEMAPVWGELIKDLLPIVIELSKSWVQILKDLTPIIKMLAELVSGVLKTGLKVLMPVIAETVKELASLAKSITSIISVVTDVVDYIGSGSEMEQALNSMKTATMTAIVPAVQLAQAMERQVIAAVNLAALEKSVGSGEISKSLFGFKAFDQRDVEAWKKANEELKAPKVPPPDISKTDSDKAAKNIIRQINGSIKAATPLDILGNIDINPINGLTAAFKPVEISLSKLYLLGDELKDKLESYSDLQNMFTELGAKFDEIFMQSPEAKKAMKEAEQSYARDTAKLKKELLSKQISLEEFQERSEEIEQARADKAKELNQQIGDSFTQLQKTLAASFDAIEKMLTEQFIESLQAAKSEFATFSKDFAGNITDITYNFEALQESAYIALGAAAASFGEALASGENAGDAFLVTLIDMVQKAILAYIPLIYGQFAVWIPNPLISIPLATAAIATLQGLLGVAKGAIGADEGVIGINERYNKSASNRDTIPIWVRKGESILTPEFTSQHEDLLTHLYGGRSEESYFRQKYIQPVSNYGVNPNGEIVKTNRALLRAIENGIEVKSTNINKIKIVDKTSNGIKYANCR